MAVDRVDNSVAPQISGAISKAAQSTGISFQYLLTTAQIESNLNPSAQASTSSAKGLYQFIEQTWLGTVKQDGASLGMAQYADAISQTADGRYEVADPGMRQSIMNLRNDPATSAMMAGALARNNADQLTSTIGRAPSEGELYAAHFLGPDGAGRLINAASNNSGASAAAMFPSAAAANRPIFYHRDGSARTVAEVYDRLTGRFDSARVAVMRPPADIPSVPGSGSAVPAVTVASLNAPVPVALRSLSSPVPDTAGVTQALASADNRPPPQRSRPLFQAMFSDGERGPVNRTVASLWSDTSATANAATGATANAAAASSATQAAGVNLPVRTLELFTDSAANVRGIFQRSS